MALNACTLIRQQINWKNNVILRFWSEIEKRREPVKKIINCIPLIYQMKKINETVGFSLGISSFSSRRPLWTWKDFRGTAFLFKKIKKKIWFMKYIFKIHLNILL